MTLPAAVTHGVIKEYVGGKLMQCTLDPRVHYHDLPAQLARHKTVGVCACICVSMCGCAQLVGG
jgi:hypothetical protein